MTHSVIVGGGPAGLAAAYRLTRDPQQQVCLLEQAPTLGGLAAGFQHGAYTLDYGPHRLHASIDPAPLEDLRTLLGDTLRLRRRRGLIWIDGRFVPYPLGPKTLLRLSPARVAELAIGVLSAKRTKQYGNTDTYESAVRSRLGDPLYELFYGPYAEKAWGLPGNAIAADQANRRVNQRGLIDLLRLAAGLGEGKHYFYPDGGFGQIPAAYAQALAAHERATVHCDAHVEAVVCGEHMVQTVQYQHTGETLSAEAAHLVWSAPLPQLLQIMRPAAPDTLLQAAGKLRYRAVVLCYVALRTPQVGAADTYYFPQREFPFNRVIEQKNFSPAMIPQDCTVLGMDISCNPDDAVFNATDSELAELVVPTLESAGLIQRAQVAEVFSRRFRYAYPVYDLQYRTAMQAVNEWLSRFTNLWLIGRQGLFLHNNTHHSLLMGYRAAQAIAEGGDRAAWVRALEEFATFRVAD